MDFFKSILSDDPEPENSDNHEESEIDPRLNQSPKDQQMERAENDDSVSNATSSEDGGGGGLWSFGGLVKTLTTRSESVLETYRRDLKEFGSGLRKESDLFREVASRAVKELPASIEVGASAVDGVLKSISQGKEALLASSDFDDSDASETHNYSDRSSLNSKRYSRFDSQLNAIQSDTRTYCGDPEDVDDYNTWKLGFVLADKKAEIEKSVGGNGAIDEIYKKVVPDEVDDATFWFRYFYRVHKLKQQEDLRANLVKRSLSAEDDEDLSWDVDDDDDDDDDNTADEVKPNISNSNLPQIEKIVAPDNESRTESSQEKNTEVAIVDENNEDEPKPSVGNVSDEKIESLQTSDEKVDISAGSGKDGDVSAVSTQPPLQEEEDLEWDEIEDIGKNDEKKVSQGDTPNKADLRKRLSTAADDEDLSWDIEDDDEPLKTAASK